MKNMFVTAGLRAFSLGLSNKSKKISMNKNMVLLRALKKGEPSLWLAVWFFSDKQCHAGGTGR